MQLSDLVEPAKPYYKVQRFEPSATAWVDYQRKYASPAAARAAFVKGKECRIMCVEGNRRYVWWKATHGEVEG